MPFDGTAAASAWKEAVAAAWGPSRTDAAIDAVIPLVASALDGATSMSEAVTALGHRTGYDGFPLVEVADWVGLMVPPSPRRRRAELRSDRCAYVLAEAWAAGRLARADTPEAARERLGHLELRLGELYDHCEALGLATEREVALAVVAIQGLPGCDETRRNVCALAESAARRIFRAGESVVVLEIGRVLVLAERHRNLPMRTRHLAQAIEAAVTVEGVVVRHWIEPLPPDRAHLSAHLHHLAA